MLIVINIIVQLFFPSLGLGCDRTLLFADNYFFPNTRPQFPATPSKENLTDSTQWC